MKLEFLHLNMHRVAQIFAESGYIDLSMDEDADNTIRAILTHAAEIVFKVQQRMHVEGNHHDKWFKVNMRILK